MRHIIIIIVVVVVSLFICWYHINCRDYIPLGLSCMMHYKGWWPVSRYYPCIHLQGVSKPVGSLSHGTNRSELIPPIIGSNRSNYCIETCGVILTYYCMKTAANEYNCIMLPYE